jgi:hypothetical protein
MNKTIEVGGNMKKYIGIGLSIFLICGVIGGVAYNRFKKVVICQTSYAELKSSLDEVVADADLIVKGKIKKVIPPQNMDNIYTDYEIDIENVIKGQSKDKSQKVIVRLPGGTSKEGIQYKYEDIKQLDKNSEYVFCLWKTFPKDSQSRIFSPVGAYQGILSINDLKDGKIKIKNFNNKNKIEIDIVNKELLLEKDFK